MQEMFSCPWSPDLFLGSLVASSLSRAPRPLFTTHTCCLFPCPDPMRTTQGPSPARTIGRASLMPQTPPWSRFFTGHVRLSLETASFPRPTTFSLFCNGRRRPAPCPRTHTHKDSSRLSILRNPKPQPPPPPPPPPFRPLCPPVWLPLAAFSVCRKDDDARTKSQKLSLTKVVPIIVTFLSCARRNDLLLVI